MANPLDGRITRAAGLAVAQRWHRSAARPPQYAPGVPRPEPMANSGGLPMSEWIVITGLTLAIVWSRTNVALDLEGRFLVKHLPLGVFAAGILLSFVAFGLRRWSAPERSPAAMTPARLLWPLLLLASGVIAGSTYAQAVDGITNTFRNLGVNMLAAYLAARLVSSSREPVRLVSTYFAILAIAGIVSTAVMAFVFVFQGPTAAPFHELEFFIIPLVVYVATLNDELTPRRAAVVWGGLATAVLFQKNTGYLVAMGTVAYLWWFHWRVTTHRANAIRRTLLFLVGLTFVAGLIAAYSLLRSHTDDYIPSGNIEFRMYTYERAWQKFLASPVWGDAFAGPSSERFVLYDTGVADNLLPTHSDILDILAQGGLIAMVLFTWAHWRVIAAANRFILRSPLAERGTLPGAEEPVGIADRHPPRYAADAGVSRHVLAMTHTLVCMALLAIIAIAFNPLLVNPVRALLIWAQFGFVAGLACHFSAVAGHVPTPRKHRS